MILLGFLAVAVIVALLLFDSSKFCVTALFHFLCVIITLGIGISFFLFSQCGQLLYIEYTYGSRKSKKESPL